MSSPPISTLFPYTTLFRSVFPEQQEARPLLAAFSEFLTTHCESFSAEWIAATKADPRIEPARRLSEDAVGTDMRALFKSRSEEHTSELQSQSNLVCRLLLE